MKLNFWKVLLVILFITFPVLSDEGNTDVSFYTGTFDVIDEEGDDRQDRLDEVHQVEWCGRGGDAQDGVVHSGILQVGSGSGDALETHLQFFGLRGRPQGDVLMDEFILDQSDQRGCEIDQPSAL